LDAASFLQRFGRVGRHRAGIAIVLVPPNAFQGMSRLPAAIDRADFEERIYAWYPSAAARPWFVTTEEGMITARSMAESLIATVARDHRARPEVLTELRDRVDATFDDHAQRLGCQAQNLQAKSAFQRLASGKAGAKWLGTYQAINQFRTSLPSVTVHDFKEQDRRRDWHLGEYETDLATLLKRARGIEWNDNLNGYTIRGIGGQRRVHASELPWRERGKLGQFLETSDFPNLLLYQDGEYTPVSGLMGTKSHVFTVVPRADVYEQLDWRLPVFESGECLLAFDGAAFLLRALWRRVQSR
jgi:hypothetical protein